VGFVRRDTMNEFYNEHYIVVDERNCIRGGFSDAFRHPFEGDICINEQGGYQFRLFPGGEENPTLFTEDGIPLYKYEGGEVRKRAAEEIEVDREVLPKPEDTPSQEERITDLEEALALLLSGVTE